MRKSRIGVGPRLLVVIAGGVVILVGLVARGIEEEYGPPSYGIEQLGDRAIAVDIDDMTAFELEELEGDRARVFDQVEGSRQVVFEGTSFEAHAWLRAQTRTTVYEGTITEVEAWVAAQRETGKDLLFPNLLIGAGALIAVSGLALGWERREPIAPAPANRPAGTLPPSEPPISDHDARPRVGTGAQPPTRA